MKISKNKSCQNPRKKISIKKGSPVRSRVSASCLRSGATPRMTIKFRNGILPMAHNRFSSGPFSRNHEGGLRPETPIMKFQKIHEICKGSPVRSRVSASCLRSGATPIITKRMGPSSIGPCSLGKRTPQGAFSIKNENLVGAWICRIRMSEY